MGLQRGWGFVARHIAKERFCLISSSAKADDMCHTTINTLQLLGFVDNVVQVDDTFNLEHVRGMRKPCVVFHMNGYTQRHLLWLVNILLLLPECVVILVTLFITAVPEFLLQKLNCIVWDQPYHVSVPFIALRCPMIKKFMTQDRRALRVRGPLLCNGNTNLCCLLDVEVYDVIREALTWQLVVKAQRRFRARRLCATVIQQAVKKWLYDPQSILGKHIVQRLTLSYQVK